MDPWVIWLIAALVLGIVEVVSGGTLVFGMLAVGAAAGAVTAGVVDSPGLPWLVFAGASAGMLLLVRPVARRHLRTPIALRSGTAALVGSEAIVRSTVTPDDGRVELGGEIWSAKPFDGDSTYDVGAHVRVLEIEGATALVG